MTKTIKMLVMVLGMLIMTSCVFAQDISTTDSNQQDIVLDEEVSVEDLEIEEQQILPDHPLYFLKDGWRKVRELFTFNPVAKLNLKEKFASEKLVEIQEMVKKGIQPEKIGKSLEKYQKEAEQVKERAMGLKQEIIETPELKSFLDKYTHQEMLHHRILQGLEDKVPQEVLEKIRNQREQHLERFKDVILKLEDRNKIPERLEETLEKIKGGEFKDFKNLEIFQEVAEKMPEDIKEKMETKGEAMLERFQERIEEMPEQSKERFENYLENISGSKEQQLEILDRVKEGIQNSDLKQRMENMRVRVLERK